jgi:hypothetical protein
MNRVDMGVLEHVPQHQHLADSWSLMCAKPSEVFATDSSASSSTSTVTASSATSSKSSRHCMLLAFN